MIPFLGWAFAALKAIAIDRSAGREALKQLVSQGKVLTDIYDMIISDIEMPQMDGYTFVRNVRELQQNIHIILHTSLSGVFNQQLVEKVGANSFVAKFDPQILADEIQKMINLPN